MGWICGVCLSGHTKACNALRSYHAKWLPRQMVLPQVLFPRQWALTETCIADERAHHFVQAMQQGWGGQQWQGGVTPLGLAQGWIRPYPMGMPQAGPLQLPTMVSRGPIQGDLHMHYIHCSLMCDNSVFWCDKQLRMTAVCTMFLHVLKAGALLTHHQ